MREFSHDGDTTARHTELCSRSSVAETGGGGSLLVGMGLSSLPSQAQRFQIGMHSKRRQRNQQVAPTFSADSE